MSSEPQEYTDEPTGIRLIVEKDYPIEPRISAIAPENRILTDEEVDAAIRRLLVMAGLKPGQAPPQGGKL